MYMTTIVVPEQTLEARHLKYQLNQIAHFPTLQIACDWINNYEILVREFL